VADSNLSHPSREDSLAVAEAARETEWASKSFAQSIFLGAFDPTLVFPYPEQPEADRAQGEEFAAKVEQFLIENLDADKADSEGIMPQSVIDGLVKLGAFSMKVPAEYGGLGFTQSNYNKVVSRVASYCASTAVWLSAHQSIGVPNPLKMFGTPEQKKRFFPRLANGELSAFALTEPGVGSDPAQMSTLATRAPDGKGWLISGKKLWTTNGPIADIMIVMARTPSIVEHGKEKKQITAFIVERTTPGIAVEHRCQFMGLRAIQNGVLTFDNVYVSDENVLWGVGKGLKLALITLNTGRLTLPACCSGVARLCLSIVRRWAKERAQWGAVIGKHEAIAEKIAHIASHGFAMDAITDYATQLADRGGVDVRIEAAMAKLFCSETLWKIVDQTLQIRGGRGFEEGPSIAARGESGFPVERIFRDSRINTIVEGTTEIMHLFLAREALDPHLRRAGALFDKRTTFGQKLSILGQCAVHYPVWFVKQLLPGGAPIPADAPAALHRHLKFVRSASKKLARRTFLLMLRHGPALERRELLLNRCVDIGVDLTVMAAACARATMLTKKRVDDPTPTELADHFCRAARRRVEDAFRAIGSNDDRAAVRVADGVLDGRYLGFETGFIDPLARAKPAPEKAAPPRAPARV
jgi:alkylation response protein AidB-like acyl-CoA dehydrogenase